MSKHIMLCLFLFFNLAQLSGQGQILDSLYQRLPSLTSKDSLAMLYLQIAKQYYFLPNQRDSLFHYADKAIQAAERSKVDHLIQKAIFTKGVAHIRVGDFEQALVYLVQADSHAHVMLDTPAIITAQTALGNIYYQTGTFDQSMAAYTEAATLSEITKNYKLAIPPYGNIANILSNQKRYQEAITYFQSGVKLAQLVKDEYSELNLISNSINTYHGAGMLDSAIILANYLMDKSKKINYQEGIVHSQIRLSNLYTRQGNFEQAIHMADQIINHPGHYAPEFLFSAYQNKAIAYDSLGHLNLAIKCAHVCLELSQKTNITGNYLLTYEMLYHLNKQKKLYHEALLNYEKLKHLGDSILGEKNNQEIIELQKLYEKEKQERQIAELSQITLKQQTQIRQRNSMLFIGLLLASVIGGFFYYQSETKKWKRAQEKAKLEQRFWRAQLNPHFFFNALSAIKKLLHEQKDTTIVSQYLSQLANLMRQTLEYNVHDYIALDEELNAVENYLAIQQFRFDNLFDYQIDIDPNIDLEAIMVPPMLIQPFLENAIEHGQLMQKPMGKIWLKIKLKSSNCLQFHIEDNGVGIPSDQQALFLPLHANGIIKERLRLFSKEHQNHYYLDIKPRKPEGTKVQLDIPIEYAF